MRNIYSIIQVLFLIIVFKGSCFSQSMINIRERFGFLSAVFTGLAVTDSCYYVSGIISDTTYPYNTGNIFAIIDLDGNIVSYKSLVSPSKTYETWGYSLLSLTNGHFAAYGYTVDTVAKLLLMEFADNGDTVKTKEYFSPFSPQNNYYVPSGICEIEKKGFLITSNCLDPLGNNEQIAVLKTDSLGNSQWVKVYGTNWRETNLSALHSKNNGYIIGCFRDNSTIVTQNFIWRTWIFKLDTAGVVQWEYLSPADQLEFGAWSFVELDDGSLIIATCKGTEVNYGSFSDVNWTHYIYKIDTSLNFVWGVDIRDTLSTNSNIFYKLIASSDGSGFVAAGTIFDYPGLPNQGSNFKGLLTKVSPLGDSLWTRYYSIVDSQSDEHIFYDLKETPDGGFVMCGEADDLNTNIYPQQAWLVKTDNYGCLVPGCQLVDTQTPETPVAVSLYPNPAKDYVHIYCHFNGQARPMQFHLLNAAGQEVKSFSGSRNDTTYLLSLRGYPPGVYFLQYGDGKESGAVKLMMSDK